MLQDQDMITLERITAFGREINALQSDIRIVHRYFMTIKAINMEEKEFINMFLKEHRTNSVFMWINEFAKPYKEMEDAKANESTFTLALIHNEVELPSELESLAEQRRFDKKVVRDLYLAYLNLQKKDMLKVAVLAETIMEYGIRDPLATLLIKKCTRNNTFILSKFIKVFYLLTQPNTIEERNKFIFSIYFQKQESIKM